MYLYTVICLKCLKWAYLYLVLGVWYCLICAYRVFVGLRLFQNRTQFILICLAIKC